MKSPIFLFFGLLLCTLVGCSKDDRPEPQSQEPAATTLMYTIAGSTTDPEITNDIPGDEVVGPVEKNIAFLNTSVNARNKLFLFFPGTNSLPSWHHMIGEKAADMGYHSIILRYNSITPIFALCANDTTPDCHLRARTEVLTGVERHSQINVDRADSIENRTIKLLAYLNTAYPDQNWGQYLTVSGEIDWEKIVVSGHSQGGGYAGLIGKLHQVEKVVMFSASDWNKTEPAGWVTDEGQTPSNRIYAFVHLKDEAGFFGPKQIIVNNWEGYGITTLGNIISVDNQNAPFSGSHTLVTNAEPVAYAHWFHEAKYHNGVIVDPFVPLDADGKSIYDPVWAYLLD